MIDIHSHILCGVDDGPKTIEETKALLEHAYEQGVRTIVSTSHRRKGMFETSEREMIEQFQLAQQIAKEVAEDLTLLFGVEIYYTSDVLERLEKGKLPTLNGTRYALIEFSMNTAYRDMHAALTKLLMQGITPVIAHIERYHDLEGPHVMKVALATAVMTGILVVVKTWVHFSPMLNVMILAVIGMLVYGIIVVGFKIIKIEEIKKLLKQS